MNPIILFRKGIDEEGEFEVASKHFNVIEQRAKIPAQSLVIGRYSCLPFYKELEEDVKYLGSEMINTYRQHRYIADLQNYYMDLIDLTPKTWLNLSELPSDKSFVLKGETNSKKFQWDTHMFAKDKVAAGQVYSRLMEDGLIGSQQIVIREYVPLRTFEIDFAGKGLPVTEEYRFFCLDGKIVTGAFYWSSFPEIFENKANNINPDNVPREFIQDVIDRVGKNARFYVIDIARTQDGRWIVIELNCGTMSGLSENTPEALYSGMKKILVG